MRPVNLHMTRGTVSVLRILIMLRAGRFDGANVMRDAVARQAKLVDGGEPQEPRIRGAVRSVASYTSFSIKRRVFVGKRTLLVGVTLDASCIATGSQSCLLELKAAMRVVAIAALHGSLEHLVMERLIEIGLRFTMTTHT